MSINDKWELRNEEVHELLSKKLAFPIRAGMLIIFLFVALGFLVLLQIRLPRTISQPLVVAHVLDTANTGVKQAFIQMRIRQDYYPLIKPGTGVRLDFSSYPTDVFGSVYGTIRAVSDTVHPDGRFSTTIVMPGTPGSSKQQLLRLRTGMTGSGTITVGEYSICDYIFN